jgi:hypothetical protein
MDATMAAGIGAAVTEARAAGTVAATIEGIVSSDAGNHSKTEGPGSVFFLPLEGGAGSAAAEDLDALFCRGGRSLLSGVTTAQLDDGRFRGSCGSPLAVCRRLGSRELDCDGGIHCRVALSDATVMASWLSASLTKAIGEGSLGCSTTGPSSAGGSSSLLKVVSESLSSMAVGDFAAGASVFVAGDVDTRVPVVLVAQSPMLAVTLASVVEAATAEATGAAVGGTSV